MLGDVFTSDRHGLNSGIHYVVYPEHDGYLTYVRTLYLQNPNFTPSDLLAAVPLHVSYSLFTATAK